MLEEAHQEALVELQGGGELAPQLPEAVQEEEEGGRLLLVPGVGMGRAGAAQAEGVPGLWKAKASEDRTRGLLDCPPGSCTSGEGCSPDMCSTLAESCGRGCPGSSVWHGRKDLVCLCFYLKRPILQSWPQSFWTVIGGDGYTRPRSKARREQGPGM